MSISVNSIGRDELEPLAKKYLTKQIENRASDNSESLKVDVKGDTVTISEEGRALSQDKERSGAEAKHDSEKADESTKSDKAEKAVKDDKAEGGAGAEETGEATSEVDKLIEKLKKKIKIVEQSIQEISSSAMPDDVKQTLLGAKNEQLSLLNNQLQQVMEQKTKANK